MFGRSTPLFTSWTDFVGAGKNLESTIRLTKNSTANAIASKE
jgi:hypothetical protein